MIAIPLDPTNLGVPCCCWKNRIDYAETRQGVVAHRPDISANPHRYQIMELEGAQLPHVLDDPKVTVAVISTTYINQTGLSPTKDGIFIEDKDSPYTNIIVTREDNKDAPNVQNFIKAYESDEVAKAAEKIFNGGAVKGW